MLQNFHSNVPTCASLLKLCCSSKSLSHGQLVHHQITHDSLDDIVLLANLVVRMYGNCGYMDDALAFFTGLDHKDKFSWNFVITASAQNRRSDNALYLFYWMMGEGFSPDKFVYPSVLSACTNSAHLADGKRIHHYARNSHFHTDIVVANALITMYGNCSSLEDARVVFDQMIERDVITWNAMINAYAQHQLGQEALNLYKQMRQVGVQPTKITFISILVNVRNTLTLKDAKYIHDQVRERGLEDDLMVSNAMISIYVKCNSVSDAKSMFENVPSPDVAAWNSLLKVYVQHGDHENAIHHFIRMQGEGVAPDMATYTSVLMVCANKGALSEGKQIHSRLISCGLQSDAFDLAILVSLYSKCGVLQDARSVFDMMQFRDVFCWNNMIALNAQQGRGVEALRLFQRMLGEGLLPDEFLFATAISACVNIETLGGGKQIHTLALASSCELDTAVATAIVNMYGKCGNMEEAYLLFARMPERNTLSWSSMIAVLAYSGEGKDALRLFSQMCNEGMLPNKATYVNLFSACANVVDLKEAKQLHARTGGTEVRADVIIGTALLNMYGKCGSIKDASSVFDDMAEQNVLSWNALLIACAQHGQGIHALDRFRSMYRAMTSPDCATFVGVLSACSHSGLVEEGIVCFSLLLNWHTYILDVDHFNCIIDTLGRAGRTDDLEILLHHGPFHPTTTSWITSLCSCGQLPHQMNRGEHAAIHGWELDPDVLGPYITLSNIYAGEGKA